MPSISKKYLGKRLFHSIFALFVLITLTFFIFRMMPADPVSILISEGRLDAQAQERIRHQFGLDQPLHIQYIYYLRNFVTGNLGMSFYYNSPVIEVIKGSLKNTLILVLPSMTLAIITGILIGMMMGFHLGSKLERIGVFLTILVKSLPIFWLAILMLMIFVYRLRWFPTGGMGVRGGITFDNVFSVVFLRHYALPFLTSFLFYITVPLLLMRNTILEVRKEDFIDFTKVRGLSNFRVIKHAMKNGILPVVTYIAVMSTFIIEGNFMLEVVFSWPGMGREMVNSVLRRDFPVAQAAFIVMGSLVIGMNFLADIIYGILDPRVIYQ